jgi:hypothetical protein
MLSFFPRDSSFPKVSGFIYNDNKSVLINANIININKVRGHEQMLTVILKLMYNQPIPYISLLGFQSLRVKVTNDWIKMVADLSN